MTNQKKNAILKIEVNTIMGKKNVENEKLANSEHEKIKKFLIAFFVAFLLIPVVINFLVSIPNPMVKGDPNTVEATWINFWGSYLGDFLSALIGAGISGAVAFSLIGKEVEANRNAEILKDFSISFNHQFQAVKQKIIQNASNIHMIVQQYHMGLLALHDFSKEYNQIMSNLQTVQVELNAMVNTNALLLQYAKEKNADCDMDCICEKFVTLILSYNKLRINYSIAIQNKQEYNIVKYYNENCVDPFNILRDELIRVERGYIRTVFPVLITENSFTLPPVEKIVETDYDTVIQRKHKAVSES